MLQRAILTIALLGAACSSPPATPRCRVDRDCGEDPAWQCTDGTCAIERADLDASRPDASPADAARDARGADPVDAARDARADAGDGAIDPGETSAWILSYFGPSQTVESDSLHLAYSLDGLHWTPMGGGAAAYILEGIGTRHIRDPFLLRREDGTFVMLATDWTRAEDGPDYWNRPSPNIVVAESRDLIEFTNPHLLPVTNLPGPGGTPMHAWAPEAFYDAARGAYAIIWSGNDSTGENRIYVSYTTDFESVQSVTPTVFFDPGYSVIDATVVRDGNDVYLFFKDETDNSGGSATGSGKDIQIARSTTGGSPGSFARWSPDYVTRGSAQGTRQATEGPFAILTGEPPAWTMCADFYVRGGIFGCWRSASLDAEPRTWTPLASEQFSFPSGVRHASTVRVTAAELDALIAHYGVIPAVQLETTYQEGGRPFFVAHSWYHAMITFQGDSANLPGDFDWHVVPGLADPNDPDLVSFEAISTPGRYLRVDSGNPRRYPPCNERKSRGVALCWVPEAERTHLAWVDVPVDSATFRRDATFRRVPALDGDPNHVSLQWLGDESRYLRHAFYQIFALPNDGSAVQSRDASFTWREHN